MLNPIQITVSTSGPGLTRKSFGSPMVVGHHSNFPELYRRYSGASALTDIVADGFTVYDPIYKQVRGLLSANNKPEYVYVGRLPTAFSQTFDLTVKNAEVRAGQVYSFSIVSPDGTTTAISYTAIAGDTGTTVAVALNTLINAVTDLSSTSSANVITVAADNTGELFLITGYDIGLVDYKDNTADSALVTEVTAIKNAGAESYGLLLADCCSAARVMVLAAFVETQTDVLFVTSYDTDNQDSGSTVSLSYQASNAGYDRTVVCCSDDQANDFAAAWVGDRFPYDAGSVNWAHTILSGVSGTSYSSSAIAAMDANNANYYVKVHTNTNAAYWGKAAGGEYIDIVRGIDWIIATMRENILSRFLAVKKIPYNNTGAEIISGGIEEALIEGEGNDFIDSEQPYTITYPDYREIPLATKQSRHYPDFKFKAYLVGAANTTSIEGVLKVGD